jgi:proteic killer suppression protein
MGTDGNDQEYAAVHPRPHRPMIVSFKDEGTRDIFLRLDTRVARKTCPQQMWTVARRKLNRLNEVDAPEDLLDSPGNRLKRLKGARVGTYSVRINDQYRLCFRWGTAGPEEVEIVDYH